MSLDRVVNVEDMRLLSKRKLPKIIFDFIEGGVEDEYGLDENLKAFASRKLWPRYYAEIGPVKTGVKLFGQDYALPVGIGVTGLAGLFRPGADLSLARAARKWKIPFVVSTFANDSLEKCAAAAGEYCWFQLYASRDRAVTAAMIGRARDAGIKHLEVTVDTPGAGKRERNMRNGFSRPLRLKPSVMLEAMTHPGWIYRYLSTGGIPMFENWQAHAPAGLNVEGVSAWSQTQTPNRQTWKDFETMRKLWPGTLIAKGVMHPEDARIAVESGADGVHVSNHGGRALDKAPASIDVLPLIRDAVGDRTTLLFDSGIRRGSDIVTALALGAKFAFVGRATLYGLTAAGEEGVDKVLDMLSKELATTLNYIGAATPADVGPQFMFPSGEKSGEAGAR